MDGVIKMGCGKSGIHFRGAEGDYDVYQYFKGNRAVFEVSVDRTDSELEIHVGKVGATWAKVNEIDTDIADYGDLFATGFRARRKTHEDRISGDSVARHFSTSRAFSVLANLYVPKALSDVADTLTLEPVDEDKPAA